MKKDITYNDLANSRFSSVVFKNSVELSRNAYASGSVFSITPKLIRELNELEHYYLDVGYAIANTLSICKQLQDIPFYLSSFSPTPKMKENGIVRYSQILYTIENYIIRSQSLFDRLLFLTNSVFNLCIDENNCKNQVIINNLKVKTTAIPSVLGNIKKELNKFRTVRHKIIHHNSYQDSDLRRLEGYSILYYESDENENQDLLEDYQFMVNMLKKKIVRNRTLEFNELNSKLFKLTSLLFKQLQVEYLNQSNRISCYINL